MTQMRCEKLSETQVRTLNKMEYDKWYCAYELRVGMNTLSALFVRDYIRRSRTRPGDMWTPRTNIEWRLTFKALQCGYGQPKGASDDI